MSDVVEVPISARQAALFRELRQTATQAQTVLNVFCTAIFSGVEDQRPLHQIDLVERDGHLYLTGVPQ